MFMSFHPARHGEALQKAPQDRKARQREKKKMGQIPQHLLGALLGEGLVLERLSQVNTVFRAEITDSRNGFFL